jgi:hypothetical protein
MNRPTLALVLLFLASSFLAAEAPEEAALQDAGAAAGLFLDGLWEGEADLGRGAESLCLRLFPADPEAGSAAGGLVDMPSRGLFGYPIGELLRRPDGISFDLFGDAPFAGRFEFEGSPLTVAAGDPFAAAGKLRLVPSGAEEDKPGAEGSFSLSFSLGSSRGLSFGEDYAIDTGRGVLPGSLMLPEVGEGGRPPVILIIPGAGADRDGNNFSVPGRSDALACLAMELRERGIASLRYDRRGAGEAYRLGENEESLRFDDHVEDAQAALAALSSDDRFSSILVLGFAEGALVGAAALVDAAGAANSAQDGMTSFDALRVSGFAALCASGRNEVEAVEEALSDAPEELKGEAAAILSALKAGGGYPNPSPYFMDYFRPSIQGYLASLFTRDIRALFAALPARTLVVAGGADLQVTLGETELLASARDDVAYRVIRGMSHALKLVGGDEEANYASFTDPSLPLADGLAQLLAAFAKDEALPGSDPRTASTEEGKLGDSPAADGSDAAVGEGKADESPVDEAAASAGPAGEGPGDEGTGDGGAADEGPDSP